MKTEKFVYDRMEFELWQDSTDLKAVKILGKKPKLILFSLPESTTVDQARYMVQGYFQGIKDGQRDVLHAVRNVQNNDLKRAYYVEENTNGQ